MHDILDLINIPRYTVQRDIWVPPNIDGMTFRHNMPIVSQDNGLSPLFGHFEFQIEQRRERRVGLTTDMFGNIQFQIPSYGGFGNFDIKRGNIVWGSSEVAHLNNICITDWLVIYIYSGGISYKMVDNVKTLLSLAPDHGTTTFPVRWRDYPGLQGHLSASDGGYVYIYDYNDSTVYRFDLLRSMKNPVPLEIEKYHSIGKVTHMQTIIINNGGVSPNETIAVAATGSQLWELASSGPRLIAEFPEEIRCIVQHYALDKKPRREAFGVVVGEYYYIILDDLDEYYLDTATALMEGGLSLDATNDVLRELSVLI